MSLKHGGTKKQKKCTAAEEKSLFRGLTGTDCCCSYRDSKKEQRHPSEIDRVTGFQRLGAYDLDVGTRPSCQCLE